MALNPCRECGKQVSDQAAACPNCGAALSAREKRRLKTMSTAGLLSGVLGCLFALCAIFSLAVLYLPFAIVLSFFSIVRSVSKFSLSGFCAAIVSIFLTVVACVVSPTVWFGVGFLGSLINAAESGPGGATTAPSASQTGPSTNSLTTGQGQDGSVGGQAPPPDSSPVGQ